MAESGLRGRGQGQGRYRAAAAVGEINTIFERLEHGRSAGRARRDFVGAEARDQIERLASEEIGSGDCRLGALRRRKPPMARYPRKAMADDGRRQPGRRHRPGGGDDDDRRPTAHASGTVKTARRAAMPRSSCVPSGMQRRSAFRGGWVTRTARSSGRHNPSSPADQIDGRADRGEVEPVGLAQIAHRMSPRCTAAPKAGRGRSCRAARRDAPFPPGRR